MALEKRHNSIDHLQTKENTITRQLDHIVYAVQDLDAAVIDFEEKLGVKPILGGFHNSFGTKNALIALDNGRYLELLATDDSNTKVAKPRWMGVDVLSKNQITRWAIKSSKLKMDSAILKKVNPEMGSIRSGSRNVVNGRTLRWNLIMPLPLPEVEILPFMVDWSASDIHPTDTMPNMGCRLIELYGTHPTPEQFTSVFKDLAIEFRIKTSTETTLKAIIACPNGHVEI